LAYSPTSNFIATMLFIPPHKTHTKKPRTIHHLPGLSIFFVEKVYRYTPSSDFDKNVPPVNIEVVIHLEGSVCPHHSQKWWVLCSFAYLKWRRRDVCNFHMIYIWSYYIYCGNPEFRS
jgi:hypothetical protein